MYSRFTTPQPTRLPLLADDYLEVYRRVFLPTSNTSSVENASINALTYSLTWLQRTQEFFFSANQNILHNDLHNFLAIPLQISVNAYQFVNYSSLVGSLHMPAENLVVATGGGYTKQGVSPWAGYYFGFIAIIVLAIVLS